MNSELEKQNSTIPRPTIPEPPLPPTSNYSAWSKRLAEINPVEGIFAKGFADISQILLENEDEIDHDISERIKTVLWESNFAARAARGEFYNN